MDAKDSERIKKIEERLETLEKIVSLENVPRQPSSAMMKNLLSLPSSLQKTMLAVQELKEATATEVSKKTGRVRSVETIYLNQLNRLKYLARVRRGRKIFFKVLRYY